MSKGKKSYSKRTKGKIYHATRHYKFDSAMSNPNTAGISKVDWQKLVSDIANSLVQSGEIKWIMAIFHDRDVDEKTREPIELHYHMMFEFKSIKEQVDVRAMVGATSDQNCEVVGDNLDMVRYLTHRDYSSAEHDKHEYRHDEVQAWNCNYKDMMKPSFWKSHESAKETGLTSHKLVAAKMAPEIVDAIGYRIKNGEIRKKDGIKELENQAGYGYVRLYQHTFDIDQELYIQNVVDYMNTHGRDNRNIYIMGAGGVGKTTLGRLLGTMLSNGKGFMSTAPLGQGKTPDALNSYTDEAVILFNEISAHGWTLDEFLACFDLHAYAEFPARNKNKDFIGHTSIFANSLSPLQFCKDLLIYSKGGKKYQDPANRADINEYRDTLDKYWQARRRFSSMIILLEDENNSELIHGYVFNLRYDKVIGDANGKKIPVAGTHILVGQFMFDNEVGKSPVIPDSVLKDIDDLLQTDTTNMRGHGEKEIHDFMEENGLVESIHDELITAFIDEVIDKAVWDLLPTKFLYSLYKEFRERYYPTATLLTIQEFTGTLDVVLTDWERKKDVRTGSKMDADEPLITEYELDAKQRNGTYKEWRNPHFNGKNPQKIREFERKNKYSGYVRK